MTADIATETKGDMVHAFAQLIGVDPGVIEEAEEGTAIMHRLFTPAGEGGVGFTDPTIERIPAFVANFINTLPAMRNNKMLASYIEDTGEWKEGPSDTLRDAATYPRGCGTSPAPTGMIELGRASKVG